MFAIKENGSRIYGYFNTGEGVNVLSFSTKIKNPKYHKHDELCGVRVKQIVNQQNKIIILDYNGVVYHERLSRYGKYGIFEVSNLLPQCHKYKLISVSDYGPSIIGITNDNFICININNKLFKNKMNFEIHQAYIFNNFFVVLIDDNGNAHRSRYFSLRHLNYIEFITGKIDDHIVKCVYADFKVIGLSKNNKLYELSYYNHHRTLNYELLNIDNIRGIYMGKNYETYDVPTYDLYVATNLDLCYYDLKTNNQTTICIDEVKNFCKNNICAYSNECYQFKYQLYFSKKWVNTTLTLGSSKIFRVKNARKLI